MESDEQARKDGFYEGMEWMIDNLLWWVFISGFALGIAVFAIVWGVISLL